MESRVSASLKRSVNETLSPRERERVRTMKSKSATVKRARQFALIIAPLPEHCQCRSQRCSRPDVFTRDGVVKNYGGRGGIRTHGSTTRLRTSQYTYEIGRATTLLDTRGCYALSLC